MKFKYIGRDDMGSLDLVSAGVCSRGEFLIPNKVYEIPDNEVRVIKGCLLSPYYELVEEKKTTKKTKKENKGDE